jgi:glucose-1-phosphate thymidylyltransferase
MKAIILAAGYATRLYPLTENQPKALLPIAGKPILDYIVDEMDTISEISEIFIVSNHKFAQHFMDWAKHRQSNAKISIVDDGTLSDETKLGAIGDIQLVISKHAIKEDLLVIAGDTFFTFKLKAFFDYYHELQHDCFLVKEINDLPQLQRMGIAELDHKQQVIGFEEKPQNPASNKASFAAYIYRSDTLPLFKSYLDNGGNPDAPGNFPAWLYKIKDVYAYIFEGECYDIGTPASYEEVNELVKKSKP